MEILSRFEIDIWILQKLIKERLKQNLSWGGGGGGFQKK